MCIAVYKPMGVDFPSKDTLKTCFNNNSDGAGFMVATGKAVEIHKGFMEFKDFWKTLRKSREQYGDDKAFVMHFRISTQGGIRKDGCHPFPLSGDMNDLRALDTSCDIGIAHNGIITLTSGGGRDITYSDTMKFITDYLSLIIKDSSYCKDDDTLSLITRLCGSRLAILDKRGHCELIGGGWSASNGVWYSNESYQERRVKTTTWYPSISSWGNNEPSWWEEYDCIDEYDIYLNADGLYEFPKDECPATEIGDGSYCELCTRFVECYAGFLESEDDK